LVDLRVRVLSHDDVVKISLGVVAFPPPIHRSSSEARTAESQLMHWRSRTTAWAARRRPGGRKAVLPAPALWGMRLVNASRRDELRGADIAGAATLRELRAAPPTLP
jgi:hypothetical protein